jgi:hypothetical protein
VVPNSLQPIEFWGIGRQVVNLDVFAMSREPRPDVPILVVGGVVLDKVDSAGKIMAKHSLQVFNISSGVEDLLKVV